MGSEGLNEDVRTQVPAILELIDDAMEKPSNKLKGEVEMVESRLVALRDQLIAAFRRDPQPSAQPAALEAVNTALSLVVSIEYPGAGIHREALGQARDLLRKFPG